MEKKDKRRLAIIATIIIVAIILWLLLRGNGAGAKTVFNNAGGITLPGVAPIGLNGSDPRLVYTPATFFGGTLPEFEWNGIEAGVMNLPPVQVTNKNNVSACTFCFPGSKPAGSGFVAGVMEPTQSSGGYLPFAWGR